MVVSGWQTGVDTSCKSKTENIIMNPDFKTDLVDRAIVFATCAHAGTGRRGKNIPYIVHPLEALAIVATMTDDPDLLAAAVLHDTVEDCGVTYEDLARKFNRRVADLVKSETCARTDAEGRELSWKERKERDMVALSRSTREEKIVAMGDKLSNMRAIARDVRAQGDAFWNLFRVKDKAVHAWRYRGLRDALSDLADTAAYREFGALVQTVFGD